jgi:hypothetical protein
MFRIRKGTQDVMTISETGDVTFSGDYQENAPRSTQSGELRITQNVTAKLATVTKGGQRHPQLEKRRSAFRLSYIQRATCMSKVKSLRS